MAWTIFRSVTGSTTGAHVIHNFNIRIRVSSLQILLLLKYSIAFDSKGADSNYPGTTANIQGTITTIDLKLLGCQRNQRK